MLSHEIGKYLWLSEMKSCTYVHVTYVVVYAQVEWAQRFNSLAWQKLFEVVKQA